MLWIRPTPVEAPPDPPPAPGAGTYTWIVLPDTQFYTRDNSGIFEAQTAWIVAQQEALNIQGVLHVGDIVEDWNVQAQWLIADAAMDALDGVVPYAVASGNHDRIYDSGTYHPNYFGYVRFQGMSGYQGAGIYTGEAPARTYGVAMEFPNNWLVIATGWMHNAFVMDSEATIEDEPGDSDTVLRAKRLLRFIRTKAQAHPTRDVAVIFHQNVYANDTHAPGHDWIFDNVIAPEPNIKLVFNGHEVGSSAEGRISTVVNGRTVNEMLNNYQSRANGGNGWLRIYTFDPDLGAITAHTYSPTLDQYEADANSDFTLTYEPGTP